MPAPLSAAMYDKCAANQHLTGTKDQRENQINCRTRVRHSILEADDPLLFISSDRVGCQVVNQLPGLSLSPSGNTALSIALQTSHR